MRLRFFILPFLFVLCISACANGKKIDACTVKNPPKTSRLVQTRAIDFKFYPAYVPDGYTGCGKIWTIDEYLVYSIQFKNGVVRSMHIFDPDGNQNDINVCKFDKNNKLTSGSVEQCPDFTDYPLWQKNPR